MKTLSEITTIKAAMSATVAAMQTRLDRLEADITRAKSDGSRSPQWIREEVEKLQHAALPFFGDKMREVQAQAKEVATARDAWTSTPYLLGMQRFSDSDRDDSTIRMRYAGEFARMPAVLLDLAANDAKADGKLAVLYQAWLVNPSAVSLEGVAIPDQAEALAAISACLAFPHKAELIAGMATSAGVSSMRKLQLAREAQAA
jgi:hypothetical protein